MAFSKEMGAMLSSFLRVVYFKSSLGLIDDGNLGVVEGATFVDDGEV